MTAQDVARLEAVRATCLAALTAAQAALQTVDAMLMTDDREVIDGDNSNTWGTFDEPEESGDIRKFLDHERKHRS